MVKAWVAVAMETGSYPPTQPAVVSAHYSIFCNAVLKNNIEESADRTIKSSSGWLHISLKVSIGIKGLKKLAKTSCRIHNDPP